MIKFDLHTHHNRCGHAIGSLDDYVKQAINNDLNVIGLSDHTPFFYSQEDHLYPQASMAKSEFENYVNEVLYLKDMYKDNIQILLGIESDFFLEHVQMYNSIFKQYPFDYIIGSVHLSNNKLVFEKKHWNNLTNSELLHEEQHYYKLIQKAAYSKAFDILGHIDLFKTNYYPNTKSNKSILERTLKVISNTNMVIEVNTSGKNKKVKEWYPSIDILERALYYEIPVTFGSDAHNPNRVGDDFIKVQHTLKDIGYNYLTFFNKRKPIKVEI